MNKLETYVLTHNRFITLRVLIFGNLNKIQIIKLLYRDSPHHDIEILMSFNFLNLSKPNENTKEQYIRKPNDKNFLFETEDKIYTYVGEKVVTFETSYK